MDIDLHGCTVAEAKAALDRKLNSLPKTCTELEVIHGYHGGTALRDFVRRTYTHPRINRKFVGLNNGSTVFCLKY